jgi:hypothetical protein
LICLLAAFAGGLAWILGHELFAAVFAASAIVCRLPAASAVKDNRR